MRVLIGVDGSAGSFAAVHFAGRILSADEDELILYYSPPSRTYLLEDTSGLLNEAQMYLSDAVFTKAKEHLPEPFRSKLQTVASTRRADHGILGMSDVRLADLIVLGARGAGRLTQPTLGSVAQHVVSHSTIPVLVVRSARPATTHGLRVLLASDGSAMCHRASDLLDQFSWPAGSTGLALTVVEQEAQHTLPKWLTEQLDKTQLAAVGVGPRAKSEKEAMRIHKETECWYGFLPPIFQGRDPLIVPGHAAEQILEAIDTNDIDLAVVGARRLGPIHRLFLGSTSTHIVNHAPCSVLIVRDQKRTPGEVFL